MDDFEFKPLPTTLEGRKQMAREVQEKQERDLRRALPEIGDYETIEDAKADGWMIATDCDPEEGFYAYWTKETRAKGYGVKKMFIRKNEYFLMLEKISNLQAENYKLKNKMQLIRKQRKNEAKKGDK